MGLKHATLEYLLGVCKQNFPQRRWKIKRQSIQLDKEKPVSVLYFKRGNSGHRWFASWYYKYTIMNLDLADIHNNVLDLSDEQSIIRMVGESLDRIDEFKI